MKAVAVEEMVGGRRAGRGERGDGGVSFKAELGFIWASEDQFFLPCMKCLIS